MEHIYAIMYLPEASVGRINQEAYKTLKGAQEFIESRNSDLKKISDFVYQSPDKSETYLIYQLSII